MTTGGKNEVTNERHHEVSGRTNNKRTNEISEYRISEINQ